MNLWALPQRPWSGRRGSNPLKRRHQKQRTEKMREVIYEFSMRCGEDVVCPGRRFRRWRETGRVAIPPP